jgi:hypothetical protein
MIVDFIMAEDDKDGAGLLIAQALSYFADNKVELAGALMLNHTFEYAALRKARFIKCPSFLQPQPFPIIFRPYADKFQASKYKNLKNWFFTMGDYDVV